jgi:DnaJ like chaperone protein
MGWLFKKAVRIARSYLNSDTVSGKNEQDDEFQKHYEEFLKEEERKEKTRQEQHQQRSQQHGRSEESSRQYQQQREQAKARVKDELYYFRLLGLQPTATNEEIKRAYKELVVKYHPDKTVHLGDELQQLAKQKTQEINEAYQRLRQRRGF